MPERERLTLIQRPNSSMVDRTVLAGLHPSASKLPLVPGNEGAGVVMKDPSGRFPRR